MSKEEHLNIDYDLIIKYLSGNTSLEESEALLAWIEGSKENAELFSQAEFIWKESSGTHFSEGDGGIVFDEHAAWNTVSNRLFATPQKSKLVRMPVWTAIAASLIIVAGLTFWFINDSAKVSTQTISYHGANHSDANILSDSSRVVLNSGAQIEYDDNYGETNRSITLNEGDAFFKVKKDTSLPFVVHAGDVAVTVLGTAFGVNNSSEDSIVVDVEYGLVEMKVEDQSIMLHRHERGIYYPATGKLQMRLSPTRVQDYWRGALLDFRGVKLKDVFETLQNVYGRTLKAEPQVLNMPIYVQFNKENIETIFEVIAITLDLDIYEQNGVYTFYESVTVEPNE
jgi:transmembrane sensor